MSERPGPGPQLFPGIAQTPDPPYYAVIFTSLRTAEDEDGYAVTAERMAELVGQQPGFLGMEHARSPEGAGITIGYFESREAIRAWGRVAEHRAAQELGRRRWYRAYALRTCRVEDARGFGDTGPDAVG